MSDPMVGSSPRMRGARGRPAHPIHVHGIIPAYAGSTTVLLFTSGRSGDHPRVCGEHRCAYVNAADKRGSSPRMRGAPRPGLVWRT